MKRTIAIIAILMAVVPALRAETVTKEKALDAASAFFQANSVQTKSSSAGLKIVWDGEFGPATKGAAEAPAFYVISNPGEGFVIISGDDRVRPVLGFSFENEFKVEGMPSNVRWWMEDIKDYCRSIKSSASGADEGWAVLTATKGTKIPDSQVWGANNTSRTNTWHQNEPFNRRTPVQNGDNCVTGCVATAVAEVLAWHAVQGHPVQNDGSTVGGYDPTENNHIAAPAYTMSTTYNWNAYKNCASSSDCNSLSASDKDNLSQLFADIGALVHANYSKDDTGADFLNIIKPMGEHMGMNKAAKVIRPEFCTNDQWIAQLTNEVGTRPVLFSGRNANDEGHAFVLDGYAFYSGSTVFHFNFGWGGTDNGFYFVDNPSSTKDFSRYHFAILDFYPDNTNDFSNEAALASSVPGYTNYFGGLSFYYDNTYGLCLQIDGITTFNPVFNGNVYVVQESKSGEKVKDLYAFESNIPAGQYGTWALSCSFSSINFGDKVKLYYDNDQGGRSPVDYFQDGTLVGELPLLPAAFIKTESSYSSGDKFQLILINNDYAYEDPDLTTTWTFTAPDGGSFSCGTAAREITFNQSGTWKVEARVKYRADNETYDCITAEIQVR